MGKKITVMVDEDTNEVYPTAVGNHPFGMLYTKNGVAALTVTPADTFIKLAAWTLGEYTLVTLAADGMTIQRDGTYSVYLSLSFSGTSSKQFLASLFIDDIEQDVCRFERKLGTAGDVGSAAAFGQFPLTVGQKVDIRIKCVASTGDVTIMQGQFALNKVN